MIAMVRDLAGLWADKRYVNAADALRRKLVSAEAAVERLTQQARVDRNISESLSQLLRANREVRVQAEATNRDLAAHVEHLEQMVLRVCGERDAALQKAERADPIDVHQAQMARALNSKPLGGN